MTDKAGTSWVVRHAKVHFFHSMNGEKIKPGACGRCASVPPAVLLVLPMLLASAAAALLRCASARIASCRSCTEAGMARCLALRVCVALLRAPRQVKIS